MNKDTTNYVILTEKMLGKLVNSRKVKVLYLVACAEAFALYKVCKKADELKKDVDYWKDEADRLNLEMNINKES